MPRIGQRVKRFSPDEVVTLSVTATWKGMTDPQTDAFRRLLPRLPNLKTFRHGLCIGIIAHPGLNNGALEETRVCYDRKEPPMSNMKRNGVLVRLCQLLAVVPNDTERREYGGTWDESRSDKEGSE